MTKHYVLIGILLLCCATVIADDATPAAKDSLSEQSGFARFFSRLYIPCEIGVSYCPSGMLKPGYTLKVALEWRHNQAKGLYYCLIYNDRALGYSEQLPIGSNLTKGKAHFSDVIIGPGYRFAVCKNFCIATLLQVGVSICEYNSVSTSSLINPKNPSEPLYDLEDRMCITPALRLSAYFEYYLFKTFALFLSAGYTQQLQPTPFSPTLRTDGCLGVNFGFTTTLY
ncbi:MAG: hypothetical protein ACI392_08675 [Paludibacteraceae bacterium]